MKKRNKKKLEELEDIRLCDEAKKVGGTSIPLSEYIKKREAKKIISGTK